MFRVTCTWINSIKGNVVYVSSCISCHVVITKLLFQITGRVNCREISHASHVTRLHQTLFDFVFLCQFVSPCSKHVFQEFFSLPLWALDVVCSEIFCRSRIIIYILSE